MANGKETQKVNSQNETWIDIAKAVCIVGVVLLHVAGYAYDNDFLYESCRFVVALFILIGGYNAIASYDRRGKFLLPKKLKSILVPYVVATVICCVWEQRFLDLKTILDALIHFNAVSPMYYVAAYVQLLIVTPVLIGVIHWCDKGTGLGKAVRYIVVWAVVLCICYLSTHYTNILDIEIGGGDMFAGIWLLFWFAGMCLWNLRMAGFCLRYKYAVAAVSTALLIIWHYVFVKRSYAIGLTPILDGEKVDLTWAHALEVLILFFFFVSVVAVMKSIPEDPFRYVLKWVGYIGKHSFDIYLYHILFRNIYRDYLDFGGYAGKIVCLLFVIGVPILFRSLLKFLEKGISGLLSDISFA
jgi:fucose 4-O-acetylase-like acetyltransferase